MTGDLARRAGEPRGCLAGYLRTAPEPQRTPPVEAPRAAIDEVSPTTVVDILTAWQRSSELPRMFALADCAALREWARAMLGELAAGGNIRGHVAGTLASLVERMEILLSNPETSAASLTEELIRIVAACSVLLADVAADPIVRGSEPHSPQPPPAISARRDGPLGRVVPGADHPSVMRRHVLPQSRRARTRRSSRCCPSS